MRSKYKTKNDIPAKQDVHTLRNSGIADTDTELGETRYGGSTNDRVLEHDTVVDVSDELGRLFRFRSFQSKQMKDAYGKLGELAILDELAQMGKGYGAISFSTSIW